MDGRKLQFFCLSVFSSIWSPAYSPYSTTQLSLSYTGRVKARTSFFETCIANCCSGKSTICSLPHTWACRNIWLASVPVTDRRERVHPFHPESTVNFAALSGRFNLQISWQYFSGLLYRHTIDKTTILLYVCVCVGLGGNTKWDNHRHSVTSSVLGQSFVQYS